MEAIEFPQQTTIIAKDQPQYIPLPAHIDETDPSTPMTVCFQLSEDEIKQMVESGGKLWYTQLTFGHPFQPVRMSTTNPFE